MPLSLSLDQLQSFRQRRAAGASVKSLAGELGVPWQRLDKALRHGIPAPPPVGLAPVQRPPQPEPTELPLESERAVLTAPSLRGPGSLSEKYRPRRLNSLFGQPQAVRQLRAFVADPYPAAFLFIGETGTGKTSAALALARELGCDLDNREFGGVHVLASGEQSAEAVRACCERMWLRPLQGSGWKVFVVNEADRMHLQAETIWLDRLEDLPPRTVLVFTTNHEAKLSQRFRDRCVTLPFEADARRLRPSARKLLSQIWKAETGKPSRNGKIETIVETAICGGALSFRRAVQLLQPHLPLRRKGTRRR